jgi:hypothetical protein
LSEADPGTAAIVNEITSGGACSEPGAEADNSLKDGFRLHEHNKDKGFLCGPAGAYAEKSFNTGADMGQSCTRHTGPVKTENKMENKNIELARDEVNVNEGTVNSVEPDNTSQAGLNPPSCMTGAGPLQSPHPVLLQSCADSRHNKSSGDISGIYKYSVKTVNTKKVSADTGLRSGSASYNASKKSNLTIHKPSEFPKAAVPAVRPRGIDGGKSRPIDIVSTIDKLIEAVSVLDNSMTSGCALCCRKGSGMTAAGEPCSRGTHTGSYKNMVNDLDGSNLFASRLLSISFPGSWLKVLIMLLMFVFMRALEDT